MQHPGNYRVVSMGTDKEGHWVIRGHFYVESASRAQQHIQIACSRSKGMCESLEDNSE